MLSSLVLVAAGAAFGGAAMEPPNGKWWAALGDSQLTALIERAVTANLDVKTASSRLIEARGPPRREPIFAVDRVLSNLRHVQGG
jgi:outer membrane protein TolC